MSQVLFADSHQGQDSRRRGRSGIFAAGWIGMGCGLTVYYVGLLMHVVSQMDVSVSTRSMEIEKIVEQYAVASSSGISHTMLVGRYLYFVSGATTWFTYTGPQRYLWMLIFFGYVTLLNSIYTVTDILNLPFSKFVFGAALSAIGTVAVVAGGCLLDRGPGMLLPTVLILIGTVLGALAFPVGFLEVSKAFTFTTCLALIIICFLLVAAGVARGAWVTFIQPPEMSGQTAELQRLLIKNASSTNTNQ